MMSLKYFAFFTLPPIVMNHGHTQGFPGFKLEMDLALQEALFGGFCQLGSAEMLSLIGTSYDLGHYFG